MERKIGEEFEYKGVRLKVVENKSTNDVYCVGCFFRESCYLHEEVAGECVGEYRLGKTNAKFIKIKDKDMKDQETKSLPIPEGWEFAGYENGEVKIRKAEPELPTDFEKALGAIKVSEIRSLLVPSGMYGAVSALCKLLIYRNAWWEKLGWRPDWKEHDSKFVIRPNYNNVECTINATANRILAFPTEEVRDKFAEIFKDLIEEAKELL